MCGSIPYAPGGGQRAAGSPFARATCPASHLTECGGGGVQLAEDGLIRTEGGDLIQNPQSNEGMPHIDGMDRFEVPRVPSEGYLTEGGETMPGRRRSRTLRCDIVL